LGQSVLLEVSMTLFRPAVLAILAIVNLSWVPSFGLPQQSRCTVGGARDKL
jgi:hypothetical protein